MARTISVHREAGGEPLFEEPLGREATVREWWSEPALVMGLPLLAAVYEDGFRTGVRWAGPELRHVLGELARLEEYWASAGLSADAAADLGERAGYLRTAVAVAEECGGFVDIG